MAVLYVDESGEEGFSDTSSEWLILAGVLHHGDAVYHMKTLYDEFKSEHFNDNWHFHFNKRSHDERLGFIKAVRGSGINSIAVAIRKPSIVKRDNFKRKYFLYFYALRFLLEKATMWCRDNCDEQLWVILSSRKGMKLENLESYLRTVIGSSLVSQDKMVWEKLSHAGCLEVAPNKEYRGLQIADCVASSIAKALEPSKFETYEPRYVKELDLLFRFNRFTPRGAVKIWPDQMLPEISHHRYDWWRGDS